MDSRVNPPKRVTSPTWGPPPPCEHALSVLQLLPVPFANARPAKTWAPRRPCNGILDSGFQAVDSGFQVLDTSLWQWNSDYGFLSFEGFCIPWAVFRNKAQDCRFHKQTFHVIRIPQAKISRFRNRIRLQVADQAFWRFLEEYWWPHRSAKFSSYRRCCRTGKLFWIRRQGEDWCRSKRPSKCVEGWLRCVTVVIWAHKD